MAPSKPNTQNNTRKNSKIGNWSKSKSKNDKENSQLIKENRPFYGILNLTQDASPAEIEKAFKIMALKVHPDKNPEDPEATEKFQQLILAYETLKDPVKRKLYDINGSDDTSSAQFMNAYEYYRTIFPKIELEDIEEYSVKYKRSNEEKEDLINFYLRFNGNVKDLLKWVPLSEPTEVERYLEILEQQIKEGKIKRFKAFDKTKTILQSAIKTPIKLKKDKKKEIEMNQLLNEIQNNRMKRENNFDRLVKSIEQRETQKKKVKR